MKLIKARSVVALLIVSTALAACSGSSSPSTVTGDGSGAANSAPAKATVNANETTETVFAAATETYSFRGIAGFETGLVKLATIDGRITSRDDVSINWGDRSSSNALFASCALLQPRLNCEVWGSHTYAREGAYTVSVTYTLAAILDRNEETETVTTTGTIEPVDGLVVVALGDSYYSGEGAPLHTWVTVGGDSTGDTALWDEPVINHFTGSFGPATNSNGNEYIGDEGLKTCHRSSLSGGRLAAQSLAANGTPITFVFMPCSGAKLGNGFADDPAGGTPGTVRDTGNFINEQLDWVRTRVPRIDVLLVSAGGNNVGFSSTINECLCVDQLFNGAASCVREDFICEDDVPLNNSITQYFRQLEGVEGSDGAPIKGEYDLFADDIDCRSVEGGVSMRNPGVGATRIGILCADVQFRVNGALIDDGVALPLVDAGYASQNGKVVDTRDAELQAAAGCHRFVIDATVPEAATLILVAVDKEDSRCGVFETEFSKSVPFGAILYVRGEFDGWARVPDWSRRFVNAGDGTLQAEFVLPALPEGQDSWRFKIAGMKEYRVPGVTMLNHYPDVTRDEDGDRPSHAETALCTGYDIAPSEWDFLQRRLVKGLFDAINDKALLYGWKTIRVDDFNTHGYCTGPFQRWMVRPAESFDRQNDLSGTAHPNWDGYEYYASQIRTAVINGTPPRTTASAEVDGAPYEFGSVVNQDVTFTLDAELTLTNSGVGSIYYGIGPDLCTPETFTGGACTLYSGPVTVSESGVNQLSFYATSVTGESETRVWPETIVIDRDPPEMTCEPDPDMVWPPNGKMAEIDIDVTAFDVVAGPADFELIAIADSNDNVAGDVTDFELFTDDTHGFVRARRDGNSPGRTYTLTYESSDPFGNSATCDARIDVPHDRRNR